MSREKVTSYFGNDLIASTDSGWTPQQDPDLDPYETPEEEESTYDPSAYDSEEN
jgi:hypothetical protein